MNEEHTQVTDAMVEAALVVWYPNEWPDAEVFKKHSVFAANCRWLMRKTLEAALSVQTSEAAP